MAERRIRVRAVVRGRVQGVFFRDSLRRLASQHNVSGWARNCGDGSLEAVFEGDPEAVQRMLAFCREGPRGAVVEGVEASEEPEEGLSGFSVR
jgi:acylphosphatase